MKRIIIALLLALPLAAGAQVWEVPESQQQAAAPKQEKKAVRPAEANPDAPYLAGAVPEEDGEVVWQRTYRNAWDAETNYSKMLDYLTRLTKQPDQLPESRVALVDKNEHKIVCSVSEWLLFRSSFLTLDRTEFDYTILAECRDKEVSVKLFRLHYAYEENRGVGQHFKAEEIINDANALNKSKTKLYKKTAKFRRKTVDRMNQLLDEIALNLRADD